MRKISFEELFRGDCRLFDDPPDSDFWLDWELYELEHERRRRRDALMPWLDWSPIYFILLLWWLYR